MRRRQRSLSRFILFSFMLRALVPLGLMLQLPAAFAHTEVTAEQAQSHGQSHDLSQAQAHPEGNAFGFVICPIQNPGIDLTVLVDRSQANGHHNHHKSSDNNENTISVDRGASLCNLWSSSTDSFLTATIFSNGVSDLDTQPQLPPATSDYQSNNFPRRLTRAPPQNL